MAGGHEVSTPLAIPTRVKDARECYLWQLQNHLTSTFRDINKDMLSWSAVLVIASCLLTTLIRRFRCDLRESLQWPEIFTDSSGEDEDDVVVDCAAKATVCFRVYCG